MTLIQRFGSALNLNIHFLHFRLIFFDGLYMPVDGAQPVFRRLPGPMATELTALVQQIAERIGKTLERRGLIERDMENAWLAGNGSTGPLDDLIGHSITHRITVGPRARQELFTPQTVPARQDEGQKGDHRHAANAGGFSLHADLDIEPHQCAKLVRLCRYVSRPPIADVRLALTSSGQVRYPLNTPHRDGKTLIVMEPLDLMARLAALVPPPRMHLGRFHGVFAPHSQLRAVVTMAHRGMGSPGQGADQADSDKPATPTTLHRHVPIRVNCITGQVYRRGTDNLSVGTGDRLVKSILMIDDDPNILLTLGVRLKGMGYTVFTAKDAVNAISAARKNMPDVVVLDISLPGGDGLQVAERLQRLGGGGAMPIIFITASENPVLRERAKQLGAVGYLTKPFDATQLADAIESALMPGDNWQPQLQQR